MGLTGTLIPASVWSLWSPRARQRGELAQVCGTITAVAVIELDASLGACGYVVTLDTAGGEIRAIVMPHLTRGEATSLTVGRAVTMLGLAEEQVFLVSSVS